MKLPYSDLNLLKKSLPSIVGSWKFGGSSWTFLTFDHLSNDLRIQKINISLLTPFANPHFNDDWPPEEKKTLDLTIYFGKYILSKPQLSS